MDTFITFTQWEGGDETVIRAGAIDLMEPSGEFATTIFFPHSDTFTVVTGTLADTRKAVEDAVYNTECEAAQIHAEAVSRNR